MAEYAHPHVLVDTSWLAEHKKQLDGFLSKNGVTNDTTSAVYGDNNNWSAAWSSGF